MFEKPHRTHQSSAPMMMAGDHFIREDEGLRPENAVLGASLGIIPLAFCLLPRHRLARPLLDIQLPQHQILCQ